MKVYRFFDSLPMWIQKLPYAVGLMLVRLTHLDLPLKIWPRNSYILGTLICTLSDLDLTFYAHKKIDMELHSWRYKLLKKFLPFLGEINYYQSENINHFIEYANRYEIERDPIFIKKLNLELKKNSEFEEMVFFLKVLQSDRDNLLYRPEIRKKKWHYHLLAFEWGLPKVLGLEELSSLGLKKLSEKNIEAKPFFNEYFSLSADSRENKNELYLNLSKKGLLKEYILFYPFNWIGSSFYHESFDHDLKLLSTFSEAEGKLLIEQVRWELWGLFTQLLVTENKAHLLMHLENIKRLVKNLSDNLDIDKTIEAIDKLTSITEASLENYKA